LIYEYLSEVEYLGLQVYSLRYPDRGKGVPGFGGERKLRWVVWGTGKSGEIREIYYWKTNDDEIWLLTVFGKSERETIPDHILRQIAEENKDV
jgi:hypothetical protein